MRKFSLATLALATTFLPCALHAADTSKQDKKFVEDAGRSSLAEVELGKLALKNSTNKDVREFATKMIQDHTKLIVDMKPFGAKMGVPGPTKMERSEQDEYDRLAKKKGESFDKDYIQTMVDDHQKDLADMTKERDTTENMALKATVAKGREVVAHHNMMIDGMAHKYGIPVPAK